MWQKFNALYKYTKSHARPSSNNSRVMDIEQFYIEKRDNFVKFLEALKTKYAPEQFQHIRHSMLGNFANLDFTSFQSYQVLLKAAIATGSIDSYLKKFMWEDGIDVKRVLCDQITKLKRYLELFSSI
jgi:hypothetical protein